MSPTLSLFFLVSCLSVSSYFRFSLLFFLPSSPSHLLPPFPSTILSHYLPASVCLIAPPFSLSITLFHSSFLCLHSFLILYILFLSPFTSFPPRASLPQFPSPPPSLAGKVYVCFRPPPPAGRTCLCTGGRRQGANYCFCQAELFIIPR